MSNIPSDMNACIPALVAKDARAALALYEKALGAETLHVMEGQNGKVMHASFKLGNTTLFINDDMEMMPRHPSEGTQSTGFYYFVEDCGVAHRRALDAGMTEHFPPTDMFWGDRTSVVQDEFGYVWTIAQRVSEPTPEEMDKARKAQGF